MKRVNINRILWSNKEQWRFRLATFGLLVGFVFSFFSIQTFIDIDSMFGHDDQHASYIVINKPVSILNALVKNDGFNDDELKEIEGQDFVDAADIFQANRYRVSASTSGQYQFYTELFFEAIGDEFVDNVPEDFKWKEGDELIPIIVSRDFLNLYNFGFAASQGLPQLAPGALRLLTVNIHLGGQGRKETLKGRVVGLSDRIASLIVPMTFMDWANKRFGAPGSFQGSKMMLKVKDPSDPALQKYLLDHNYESNKDRMKVNKIGAILKSISIAIEVLGLLLILFSVTIYLSIFRIQMSQAKAKIALLLDLAYHPKLIAWLYLKRMLISVIGTYIIAIILLCFSVYKAHIWFNENGFDLDHFISIYVVLLSLAVLAGITIACYRMILKEVKQIS